MKNNYWLHGTSEEAISYLEGVRASWDSWVGIPVRQAWVRNYLAYYSAVIQPTSLDSSLIFDGVQGELVRMYTPKARSLIQQQVTLITKQRLAANCLAQTEGSEVANDVSLGNSLLDQIIQNEQLDLKGRELCEGGLVVGGWFTETTWRTDKGAPYTRDENGTLIYTGAVSIDLRSVFDVFYDITVSNWEDLTSLETRSVMNRYDLIAQHPELETQILALPSISQQRGTPGSWWGGRTRDSEEFVYVYKCYAKRSPALPVGRMIIYGASDCVFYDDENIYDTIPVVPFFPDKVLNLNCGYPQLTNLMAAQEMYDNSLSAIATNQSQFAVQSVTVPRASGIDVQELSGMRIVSFTPQNVPGGGKPEPMQLTQSAPETFKFAESLDKIMMDISGIPGAMRGNPPPGVTSGVAIATLSANAMEFMNSVSMSYFKCWEKTLENALNCYKKFAKLPQSIGIIGKNSQMSSRQFKGENIQGLSGVKIQISNPLMQTIAGRLEIAEKLMQMPRDLWPQYVSILEGRPLSDIYKGDLSQSDLIYSENELLSQGQQVMALASDDHGLHAKLHSGLLNDPTTRKDGGSVKVILDHILEHEKLAKETDQFFMAMIRTGKTPEIPVENKQAPSVNNDTSQVVQGAPVEEPAQPAQDALGRS